MNFSTALEAVKAGKKIQRLGWNGKGLTVQIQRPDTNSKMTLPYLFIEYPNGLRCPWLASQTDILAEDWQIISEVAPASLTSLRESMEKDSEIKKRYAYRVKRSGQVVYKNYEYSGNQYIERYADKDQVIS